MPLLLTGGVELLEPQAVRTEPKERARTMATRVARAGCEYSPHLLFEVGNVLVSSSVTTYQCPAMTNRTWIPGTSSGIPCGHHSNARTAWERITSDPRQRDGRQHPFRGSLGARTVNGEEMDQWQYEVTSGGRLWYCIDDKRRTILLTDAMPGHPKATE